MSAAVEIAMTEYSFNLRESAEAGRLSRAVFFLPLWTIVPPLTNRSLNTGAPPPPATRQVGCWVTYTTFPKGECRTIVSMLILRCFPLAKTCRVKQYTGISKAENRDPEYAISARAVR